MYVFLIYGVLCVYMSICAFGALEFSYYLLDKRKEKRGNRTKVSAQVYAVDQQQAPGSSEATEGKNFEDEIS